MSEFKMIYTPEVNTQVELWRKILAQYDTDFMRANISNERQDLVVKKMFSCPHRKAIMKVGETIMGNAIPVGVIYE